MGNREKQEKRLDYLLGKFLADSDGYGDMDIPKHTEEKRMLLRSLMNIRLPRKMDETVLKVQDEYLKERAQEKGIVRPSDILLIRDHLSLWQGDITRLAADGIVNAANSQMLGCFIPLHSCIDNCIHTYAGIELRAECFRQMTELRKVYGEDYEQLVAVPLLTDGFNLPARKIIHVVGPMVSGHLTGALEEDLARCYRNTLDLCRENGLRTLAFCCISTGVFHFPSPRAAEIAVHTVTGWMEKHPGAMDRVIFNVFKEEDRKYYEQNLR